MELGICSSRDIIDLMALIYHSSWYPKEYTLTKCPQCLLTHNFVIYNGYAAFHYMDLSTVT